MAPLNDHLLHAMNLKSQKDLRSVVSVAIKVNRSDELLLAFGLVRHHWNDKDKRSETVIFLIPQIFFSQIPPTLPYLDHSLTQLPSSSTTANLIFSTPIHSTLSYSYP